MPFEPDSTGVHVPALDEAVRDMLVRFAAIFGVDLSISPQTPQAQLAGIWAAVLTEIGEVLAHVSNGYSIDHAAGAQLDTLAGLLQIGRLAATHSTVTATLTGVAGTVVPAGSRAATADGDEFAATSDTVLSVSGVTTEMRAVNTGPVEAAAAALTRIVTVVSGWERVTNTADAAVGRTVETDAAYRARYRTRTALGSTGPLAALAAAVVDAGATKHAVVENATDTAATVQNITLPPFAVAVVASGGADSDLSAAVRNHKGMGVPMTVAIRGGTPDNTALNAVTDGTVTWNGTDYTGLDLSAASTSAAKAAALTTLLDGSGVTVVFVDGAYVATFAWRPDVSPVFTSATVDAFGLNVTATDAGYPMGPFIRARARALTVTVAVTRQTGFPADGIAQIRAALFAVVAAYETGEQLWNNDLLVAVERIGGSRVTSLTVQLDGVDVSGIAVPLDGVWSLDAADLTVTVT